ncbi:hypothetical protein SFRURICE_017793 [Spodoptera frugiperda]|nr:hypothetical protein SFRURICE_017793 [Spodoptera frugiperda]
MSSLALGEARCCEERITTSTMDPQPHDLVTCPYNPAHQVEQYRMHLHLNKCSRQNVKSGKTTCPFDVTHVVDEVELDYHVAICPKRGMLDTQRCTMLCCCGCVWLLPIIFIDTHNSTVKLCVPLLETDSPKLCLLYGNMRAITMLCKSYLLFIVGECHCQEGSHFFLGRCWKSIGYGDQCTRNEECMGVLRDPYSFACIDGVCACAEGYYERQRGECREGSFNVGDDCMVHEDCRFEGGVCDLGTLKCVTPTAEPEPEAEPPKKKAETKSEYTMSSNLTSTSVTSTRNHGRACSTSEDCPNVFECTSSGYCACPRGYYANAAGSTCLAELGSPSTNNQCAGFLAQVIDGICRCPKNYYYHENMRDCIKATRRFNDACVDDNQCHTFGGSARCGEPGTFYLRTCDCIAEEAVWDENRQICRLFAGIGEYCEVDSDCLAGNMEILCVHGNGDEICLFDCLLLLQVKSCLTRDVLYYVAVDAFGVHQSYLVVHIA